MPNLLPTRRQTIQHHRGRNTGLLVTDDNAREGAIVALRKALLLERPTARCFFYDRDLNLTIVSEGHCAGTVLCRSVTDGAQRVSPPTPLEFEIYWSRAKGEFNLPTVEPTSHTLNEV
jgi:hypothetical protein